MTLVVGHAPDLTVLSVPNGDHVLLIGPPGSGKTAGFLVPSVLGHDGPVVVTSSKADVAGMTSRFRAGRGRCLAFDPGGDGIPGTTPVTWDPLRGCESYDEAILRGEALVQTVRALSGGTKEDGFWYVMSSRAMGALLHAARLGQRAGAALTVVDVLRWATTYRFGDPEEILRRHGALDAADIVHGISQQDEKFQDSTMSGVVQALRVFDAPAMHAALRTREVFDADEFVTGRDTLYVVAPLERQQFFAALVVGLLDAVTRAAMRRAAAQEHLPREQRSAVVLALDEVANIAPLHTLPRLVSAGGGQGVQVMAVLQDLSQAAARWGEAAAGFPTLFQHKVVLPGVFHHPTLEAFEKCLPQLAGPAGGLQPEWPASRIAALRRHTPHDTATAYGQALWVDGAVPRLTRIHTFHDAMRARQR